MKKMLIMFAAALSFAPLVADDTDCGALITTTTIESTAKVENLTGASAGKATITINNNSGTANSVTVYNSATIDTALSGKASTGDVTALQTRAAALETATNNLTAAAAAAQSTADAALPKSGGTVTGDLIIASANVYWMYGNDFISPIVGPDGIGLRYRYAGTDYNLKFPGSPGDRAALLSDIPTKFPYTAITNAPWITTWTETDPTVPSWAKAASKPSYNFSEIGSKPTTLSGYGITDAKIVDGTITLGSATITPLTSYAETDPTVPSWAKASSKPSYNFSEIGSKPTTISGYGITDAKIANGTITLGSASITPLTSYTETDPTALKPSQLKVNGTAMTTASAAVELGQYYVKTVDGKPHLFLRN